MEELFSHIERKIKALIQRYEQEKYASVNLKQVLLREKETLLSKHKSAVSQIESMVIRLKTFENQHE